MQAECVKPYEFSEDTARDTIDFKRRELVAHFKLISSPFVIIPYGTDYDECNNYWSFLTLLFQLVNRAHIEHESVYCFLLFIYIIYNTDR